jgi:phosphoribosylanthranilate isomerase
MAAQAKVKICGLTDPAAAEWAAECGASYLGAVFFAKSPRHVGLARAAEIFEFVPAKTARVGLFVDPTDAELNEAMNQVRLTYFQLHGRETPERVEQIRLEFGMPVIKALGIHDAQDLFDARAYDDIADMLLFDAKPAADATRPGGLGHSFDWRLLRGQKFRSPWFLAGGLTADNVGLAIAESGAKLVDVSSGVEAAIGIKDPDKLAQFIRAAKGQKE